MNDFDDNDIVLRVDGVRKKFCSSLKRGIVYGSVDLAKEMLRIKVDRTALREREFWAVNDVSFQLHRGESLGLVGTNGSGKTTLLKLIAGIFPFDQGQISINGRVGALIALGAGFHPHMTGEENIVLNASLLGMSKQEISDRFDEIVEFADIGDFLQAPVSTYSSGMKVRLGFSVASHADVDLLLVDEVLAVGDLGFALKCYRKMVEYRKKGGATILVSHSNQLIRNFCDRAILLKSGEVIKSGETNEVCDEYERMTNVAFTDSEKPNLLDYDKASLIERVEFLGTDASPRSEFKVGEEMTVRIHFNCARKVESPIFSVTFESIENQVISSNFSHLDGERIDYISGSGHLDYKITVPFKRGVYYCTVTFCEKEVNYVLSWHERFTKISIVGGNVSYGFTNPFPEWKLKEL